MAQDSESGGERLGIMGGTFDPIHLGHLVAASEALHHFALDRIIFIPAARPWQKESYSDAEDRFLMTSFAASAHPRFAVSRMELDRKGPTYTYETMASLREFHGPAIQLFFIVGADAVLKLGSWHGLEHLRPLASLIAVTRPGHDLEQLKPVESWPEVEVMEMPAVGISSTDIRERVRSGRPIDFLVPQQVAGYIREQGLYVGSREGV
ncbi:MAG TPA: nicotinate-nucleotide adenylyltransferase [Actinomycetota bacterium]|nr:nicotinate-nucleotide adenylyltransferase [Actinomycetota bacterium]